MTSHQVAEYLKAEREPKRKFEEVKFGRYKTNIQGKEIFAPILTPLQEINTKIAPHTTDHAIQQNDELATLKRKFEVQAGDGDVNYGIHSDRGHLYVGCKEVEIVGDNLIFDNGKKYLITPGLWALLTKNQPSGYNSEDLQYYGEIVRDTFAYKHRNNPKSDRLKSNRGAKYTNLIKPIIDKYNLRKGKVSKIEGKGLRKVLTPSNHNIEYVYWNSLDELLERLYILYGELKAGNTNPTIRNEISNIIQEFKEI